MPKFKIKAVMTTYLTCVVEAENEDAAFEIAKKMDGSDFKPLENDGDWYISDVEEIDA